MGFDIEGARKAGYSESEIVDHLAQQSKFDAGQARKAGYSDAEILTHLIPASPAPGDQPTSPVAADASKSYGAQVVQNLGDEVAGLVRGAGSIGATLLYPIDKAQDLYYGDREPGLTSLVTGKKPLTRNQERRAGIDGGLEAMGAQPDSAFYKGGKIAGEIAGTAGAGGAVANTLRGIPVVAKTAAPVLSAIESGGMTAGGLTGAKGLATRALGGAVSGGASAGLVDPAQAGAGAVIGAGLPVAVKAAGAVGHGIGKTLRGPDQSPELAQAVTAARDAGYVIPPTQAKPTLANRLLEGFSGKLTTAQNASAKNQTITNKLAAEALGLPADTKLTPELLNDVRSAAGKAYEAIGNTGTVTPGKAYGDALDNIAAPYLKAAQGFPGAKPSPVIDLVESLRSPSFDASSAVAKIKELRSAADDAFRTGNTDIARASKSAAKALEDTLENHLIQSGDQQALTAFRDARQLIAKTYGVDKALNPASGSVDAKKLASQLAKGKPLSGKLKDIAGFAAQFPKAAQTVEGMGSLPQTSPLDWGASAVMSAATANPLMMAGVAARPAARKMVLSDLVQNRLIPSQGQGGIRLADLLANPSAQKLIYRSAPVALTDR